MYVTANNANPASPGILGLFGFAFATFLANLGNLGLIQTSDLTVGTAIFLGGVAQVLAGILSYTSRDLFGLTTYTAFGLFWTNSGVETLLLTTGKIQAAGATANFWYLLLWTVVIFALLGASLKTTWALISALVFADLLLAGLAFGTLTGSAMLIKFGAVCGLISAVLALYMAIGNLWNLTYGRTILPQGERSSSSPSLQRSLARS